jgi:hypothetical protein
LVINCFRGSLGEDLVYGFGKIDSSLDTVSTWLKGPVEVKCLLPEEGKEEESDKIKCDITYSQNTYVSLK